MKDKRKLNAEGVVSVLLSSHSDSDSNESDEEWEDCFEDASTCMNRLSMELGMMADKHGGMVVLLYLYRLL